MAMPASSSRLEWEELATAAHAWQLRTEQLRAPAVRDRWLARLPAEERAQYESFLSDEMREEYLAARVLCRATLSRYTGVDPGTWRFDTSRNGKPVVAAPERFASLQFNLTHTKGLAICVVTRAGMAGVDAEDTSQPVDVALVARHFFSRGERARLAGLPSNVQIDRFFEQWVLKEAFVKATGAGLAHAGERLTVAQRKDGRPISTAGCAFSLHRPSPHQVAAVAVLAQDCKRPLSFQWRAVADIGAASSRPISEAV